MQGTWTSQKPICKNNNRPGDGPDGLERQNQRPTEITVGAMPVASEDDAIT